MRIRKEEKGAVTLFVLVAGIFLISTLLLVNIGIINKNTNQEKELEKIVKDYTVNETDMGNTYVKVAEENTYLTASQIIEIIYPIGSIYISTNAENPSNYIGGTWESYGEGRTLIGAGTGTDANNTQKIFGIGEIGGEYTHTLTVAEMPSHSHKGLYGGDVPGTTSGAAGGTGKYWYSMEINSAGGDQAHNNLQPYIVTYMWKRIN